MPSMYVFMCIICFFYVKHNQMISKIDWNGQSIIFMPCDIKSILPNIFNMDWRENNEFANRVFLEDSNEETGVDGVIKRINELGIIKDTQFSNFMNRL